MNDRENVFGPGPTDRTVQRPTGEILTAPCNWRLLPPGDAALTRRVKAAGAHWVVQEKKGRKIFSLGVWAPQDTIERIQADLVEERSTPSYSARKLADSLRRSRVQVAYVDDFTEALRQYLNFAPQHAEMADRLAQAVADHATPVGSGTVARTKRIPIQQRAQAAVIAWLRHQTTAYDSMVIARVKGQRRETRRALAARSKELLNRYRAGETVASDCPLQRALQEVARS
ncbi:MAG: DUF2293 domain-containing protein [Planctomycetota bacterium]|nr:DUF2293 domain-containing protein [Planctomycetota bacterium]MDA1179978.1 DUF2293 domain-containing protein [Planctomycetota bacterium]